MPTSANTATITSTAAKPSGYATNDWKKKGAVSATLAQPNQVAATSDVTRQTVVHVTKSRTRSRAREMPRRLVTKQREWQRDDRRQAGRVNRIDLAVRAALQVSGFSSPW